MKYLLIAASIVLVFLFLTISPKQHHSNYYVINLERRPERLQRIVPLMNKHNISAHHIKAVDGLTLNENILASRNILMPSRNNINRDFRPGEIGCFMSHVLTWETFLASSADYAIIFEDDVVIFDNFEKHIKTILNEAKHLTWDILYLGRNCVKHFGNACNVGTQITHSLVIPDRIGYGAFAYVINKASAQKLLKNAYPMYEPLDDYIVRLHQEHKLTALCVKSDIVTYMTIGVSDTNPPRSSE